MSKKRKKTPRTRVYFSERELNAIGFLRNFPDFNDRTDSQILRACLMIVAIDAKIKFDEARRQDEEAKKSSDSDTSGEPNDDSVRGTDASRNDNKRPEEVSGEAEE